MVGIVDYGMGNLRSVQKAFEHIGEKAIVSGEKDVLDTCDRLVLPGVGSFGQGMEELQKRGLDTYLKERSKRTVILGICLGMQFLLSRSFEDGEHEGLDFVHGQVVKFKEGKIPQIGWNSVHGLKGPLFDGIEEGSDFYFVHSFYADTTDEFAIAKTDYHVEYASAVQSGNVYGVQFHPEKSGFVGIRLLKNFLKVECI
ncbi:MAG: imidazole glycerol phosphate synthase subunit HisH [Clostridia bacterium]|nr:imidazole glycerol phosphate synthase subunit HisH [Clostridia bacterium]